MAEKVKLAARRRDSLPGSSSTRDFQSLSDERGMPWSTASAIAPAPMSKDNERVIRRQ
jgi:hypothetical protein